MIKINCGVCGSTITRAIGEVNRTRKRGGTFCCSKTCQGKVCVKSLPLDANRDEFSPFRKYLSVIKGRKKGRKKHGCQITLADLKNQWEKQKGICPYTGWKLCIPPTSYCREELNLLPNKASVDRIDSSKPYSKNNIQFVAMIAQFAKNQWSSEQLIAFCKAVTDYHLTTML